MIETLKTHNENEAHLILESIRGNKNAFEKLYRLYAPQVYALAIRMTAHRENANDLLQVIFIKIWKKLPEFRGESKLSTWIHTIAVREIVDFFRKNKIRFDGTPNEPLYSEISVDMALDLDNAVNQLPAGARAILILHDVEGYTHEEIGNMCGISVGTSKSQLHRARRLLKEMLT